MAAVVYHISPSTGNPNICRAKTGNCPYGSPEEHYGSKDEARKAYEATQAAGTPQASSKPRDIVKHTVRAADVALAEKALAKANRRLERAGRNERFTWTVKEVMLPAAADPQAPVAAFVPAAEMHITMPPVSYGDHRFLAVVERIPDAPPLIKAASNSNLKGFKLDKLECDHCGRAIARQKTYLVEDKDGNKLQVGGSCVKGFLGGVSPDGLWALGYDPLADSPLELEEGDTAHMKARRGGDFAVPSEEALAYALAVSNGGKNFVGSSAGGVSTKELVLDSLFDTHESDGAKAVQLKAQSYIANGQAQKLLRKMRNLKDDSEFAQRLKAVAASDHVRQKHLGILVAALAVEASEKRAKDRKKKENFLGEASAGFTTFEGGPLAGHILTVKEAKSFEDSDPWGHPVTRTKVVMRDEENHEVVWWASRRVEAKAGSKVEVTSGRVKKHQQYKGVDQTVATRLKLKDAKGEQV